MIIHASGFIKKSLLLLLLLVSFFLESRAQDCSIPIIVDLRASPNISKAIPAKRKGNCCGDQNCVTFKIYLNPGSDLLSFSTSQITGAGFYSIDCGSLIPSGTAACLSDASDEVIITYCKPGGNEEVYTIKASTEVSASADINLRQGCTGEMFVNGLQTESITWTSIYPGTHGQYNSYLSCTSGCPITYVTPLPGAPAYIDYQVSGPGAACAGTKTDTIRVYTSPPLTVDISPANPAICSDGSGSTVLTAVTTGGIPPFTYLWSDGQTTPSITVNTAGSYSVTVLDNTVNCAPVSQSVEVAAIPTPATPSVDGTTICSGNTAVLTATSPGGTYQWFNSASGGTLLFTGDSFTTPVLITSMTYYVQTTVNGCTSQRTPVTVNVTPVPAAPIAQSATICSDNAVTLSATSPGGIYQWFDSASGGTLLGTGPVFTTPVLTTTTSYYVQTTVNNCTSPRTRVTVTVKPVPPAPAATGASICSGSSAKLTATAPGGNYAWFSASEGGELLATTPDLFTPILTSTTTYYVQTTVNGCTSARSPVTVTVNPLPQAPAVADLTICQYSSATFNIADAGEIYRWYDAPENGNLLSTGSSFTTPPLSNTTTYYVDATSVSGCTGIRTAVTATINYPKNPAFVYSSGTYCISGIDPIPTIIGGETGTFSAGPGLVFTDPNTGEIDLSASLPGLYEITFIANNPCAYTSTVSLTITNAPDASFTYSNSYCRKQNNAIPVFLPGSSAGTFSASPTGLVFLNASTGEIDLNLSAAGTYTITNLIAAAAGCSEASFSQVVTINPESIADAGPDQTICSGNSVILNGQIGGSATSGKWSGGLGTFSDVFALNAVYTPAAGETSVYLTLTADTGPCDGQNNTMHITIEPTPVITSSASKTVCNDQPQQYTITSSVSGTTFTWSRAPVAGIDNMAVAGQTSGVINEVLHNSTLNPVVVNYEITPVASGCTGGVFIYQVTVNPTPTVTGIASDTVCNDELQNYTITGGVGNTTFIWNRAEIAGISNPAISGQTSDKITETLHNATPYPLIVTYEIIPMANGCAGATFSYEVTVNPSPVVTSDSSGTICNDQPQNYTITSDVSNTTFSWSRAAISGISNPAVTGQTSSIITETLHNSTNSPVIVSYEITPAANGCTGNPFIYTVTVNPTPMVTSNTSATVCNDKPQNYTIAGGSINTTFVWSRAPVPGISNTAVTGRISNVITETLHNITTSPVTVSYEIIPRANGCTGDPFIYTVTVNPTPTVNSSSSATVCNDEPQNYTITGGVNNTTFTWSRAEIQGISNPAVMGQSGNVITETLHNSMATSITVSYEIIPAVNGCPGDPFIYSVTVKPTPTVTSNPSGTLCNDELQNYVITGSVNNSTFSWSRAEVAGISNPAVTGQSGDTITEALHNNTDSPIVVSYQIIPMANGCSGDPFMYSVTINPTPGITSNSAAVVCNDAPQNYTITGNVNNTSFTWSRLAVAGIGNPAVTGQTGNVISETLHNSTNAPIIVSYEITPQANGCTGDPFIYKVTVNPTPAVSSGSSVIVCNDEQQNYTITSDVSNTTFSWSRAAVPGISNPAVSGQTGGIIAETLHNDTDSPVIVSYEITPILNGCAGNSFVYNVTVNPTPSVSSSSSATICNDEPQNYIITAGVSGTSFSWSRADVAGISNPAVAGQTSNVITETIHNNTTSPITVSYQIIPTANGCTGTPFTYNVTVNPTPVVTSSSSATVCSDEQQNYIITGGVTNTVFTWSRTQVPGISNAATVGQTGSAITETLHNTTASPVIVSYEIIPTANGCTGDPFIYIVTVNPTPAVTNTDLAKTICSGETLPPVILTSDVSGTTFSWTATASGGITGFTGNGNGDIPAQTIINTSAVSGALTYSITAFHDGCQGATKYLVITVNPIPSTPLVTSDSPLCAGSVLNLGTPAVAGASYSWSGPNGFVSNEQNPSLPNLSLAAGGTYFVQTTVNGCTSSAGTTEVTVVPLPSTPAPLSNSPICAGSTLILSTTSIAGASYNWTGPNGFSSSLQNPEINNASSTASGTYSLTVTVNGCPSAAGTTEVAVNSIPPAPLAGSNSPLCAGNNVNLSAESISGATYTWTGPNGFSSNLRNPVISSASLAHAGTYYVTVTIEGCTGPAQPVNVEINTTPIDPVVTATTPVCAGETVSLEATEFAGAVYTWTGPAGFTSNLRNPVINNASPATTGTYTVIISSPGCGINITKDIFVKVNDIPTAPTVSNNGPVCEGGTIRLSASSVPGASYSWTGPNGFISSLQNPDILNATMLNAGIYQLFITVDGCVSRVSETRVAINEASVVNAGTDHTVCSANPLVALDGKISGGSSTGIWSTSGTGTFPQGNTSLMGIYSPSPADIISGSIRLTLTSTNNKCDAVVSSFVVTIQQAPAVAAGPDQEVCSNNPDVKLNGSVSAQYGAVWSSSGTGRFSPSNADLNATYIPGREDISTGNVILRLSSTGNGTCSAVSDELNISIIRPPVITALTDIYIFENESLVLEPKVSGENLEYSWAPFNYLSDSTIRNPSVKGVEDITYTLTVKGRAGCVETSQVSVKVLKPIKIPNTFTPNNDGVNDVFNIRELDDYPGVSVTIFNRYGSKLFSSQGYDSPWDGTHNGNPVPTGVYYYVIDIPVYNKTLSGYITVIK
ncbi:PKD-like domain-containing protein [Arcticibacter tournemirensis]|uniref:T9SS type B sorting domain-containing protein n=1 Tax=Arcticibacter tournemirensis TaxID=699437 RepID=A0A4Q0M3A5_9SPHI|nr:PKD-like domain-containing protein [Arcticibacter tournemirensis]RXF67056.1 T9SS type B sorting domain-containing protein [Arcticibacter tournemirensis]